MVGLLDIGGVVFTPCSIHAKLLSQKNDMNSTFAVLLCLYLNMNYTSETIFEGKGRCVTTHKATGKTFATDLHRDLGGYEENPTPGEMLAATLASCMASMISVVAARKGVEVTGMKLEAAPCVDANGKIEKIKLKITMPLPADYPYRDMIQTSAMICPVHQALNPSIETPVEWYWQE